MLEERRVRELLDPLNHHHLLQLQQLQQQAAAQVQQHQQQQLNQSHHHHRGGGGGGERDRRDRDLHHHHRDRGDREVRERQYHHSQQVQHRDRGERDRERERERDHLRAERHQAEQILQQHLLQQQQQLQARGDASGRDRERDRENRERDREINRERDRENRERDRENRERDRDRERERLERERDRERERENQNREREMGHHGQEHGDDVRKQFDCQGALPKGWVREEIVRKTGLSAGKIDVCYHSPNGKKFWSKPQLSRFLGDSMDLSTFDFRTGKMNNLLLRKNKKHRPHADYSRGIRNDTTLQPPIRQTASIFKQPVTVHKTQKLSTVKIDFKHGHQEKPKQLFWEKRLEGLRSCDPSGHSLDSLDLPRGVEAVGPNIQPDTVLQSVATALHVNGQPITGQTMPRPNLETNPGVYLNPDQPLIQACSIREDDINKQEERVLVARKKLEDALKAYDIS